MLYSWVEQLLGAGRGSGWTVKVGRGVIALSLRWGWVGRRVPPSTRALVTTLCRSTCHAEAPGGWYRRGSSELPWTGALTRGNLLQRWLGVNCNCILHPVLGRYIFRWYLRRGACCGFDRKSTLNPGLGSQLLGVVLSRGGDSRWWAGQCVSHNVCNLHPPLHGVDLLWTPCCSIQRSCANEVIVYRGIMYRKSLQIVQSVY